MSLQLPTILSPPTSCTPVPALTALAAGQVAKLPLSLSGSASVLGFAMYQQARQCIRPYRVYHFLNYGLVVRFRLLPTPPLGDAVSFSYGQPVFCPMGTSTPLLVRTFGRTGTGVPPVSDQTEKTGGTPVPLFQPPAFLHRDQGARPPESGSPPCCPIFSPSLS